MHRPRLTAEERARLRPTINVSALERFLQAVPQESREFYFLACANNVTDAELLAMGMPVPAPPPPPPPPSVPVTPPGIQPLRFLPARRVHFVLHHVPEPELDRLWQDVEPTGERD